MDTDGFTANHRMIQQQQYERWYLVLDQFQYTQQPTIVQEEQQQQHNGGVVVLQQFQSNNMDFE